MMKKLFALFKAAPEPELSEEEAEEINERVEATAGICHLCEHRGDDLYVCKAYPEGIPVMILAGLVSHLIPQDGDNGVQFSFKKESVEKADITHVPRDDRGRWTKVGQAQGSNKGGVFQKDLQKYYVKFPNSSGQVAAEVASDKLHELMGVQTMRHEARYLGDKLASVSKLQHAEPLGRKGWEKLTDEQKQQAANAFVASAWAKNWDVVGLAYDNMAKTPDGNIAIVDTGGSFMFRAQGEHKPFGASALPEITAFLDPSRTSGAVFGPLHDAHPEMFVKAVGRLKSITDKQIKDAVAGMPEAEAVAGVLKHRRQSIVDYFDKP